MSCVDEGFVVNSVQRPSTRNDGKIFGSMHPFLFFNEFETSVMLDL